MMFLTVDSFGKIYGKQGKSEEAEEMYLTALTHFELPPPTQHYPYLTQYALHLQTF